VKGGVLTAYNSTTVGKAFGGTFQNAKWTSFETPKGVVIVEVNGTIKEKNRPNYFTTNLDTHILTDRYCKASLGLDAQTDYQSLPPDDERKRQLNRCINTLPDDADLPVKFQFTVSADRNSFQLSYGDIQSEKSGAVLDFIYN
jgi:hypothetical protein